MAQRTPQPIPTVALVTGAARRVGRAIALGLAADGFDIALHFNASAADAERTAGDIRRLGRRVAMLAADLGEEAAVEPLIRRAEEALGPVGVLVNSASIFDRDRLATLTRESWDRHMATNLRAPVVLMQQFAARLPDGADGVIVNIIDQRVFHPTHDFLSYTLTKTALYGLTRSLALDLAPRIRVVGVGPGPILPSPHQTREAFDQQAAATPLNHGADPDEVAAAVRFLVASPSVTGQMIAVDAGQHLWWAPPGRDTPMD